MKILLINPAIYADIGRSKTNSPLISLLYLAGYLEKNGYPETKIFDTDAMRLTWSEVGDLFLKEKPDIVGISGTTFATPALIKTARTLKQVLPNCLVIVGGHGPSNEPEKILRMGSIDFVVMGEGEETLLELVKAWQINRCQSPDKIKGIAFINKAGEFTVTEKRGYIKDLDSLSLPAFHLLTPKFEDYPGHPIDSKAYPEIKKPVMTMVASRGCPHRCAYCSLGSRMYRQRNPKKIVDEMELYKNKFGVKSIVLYDDEFIGMSPQQNEWIKEICEELIKRKLGLKLITEGRCSQYIELETLKKMKEAGFVCIWWGVESGSQKVLDDYIHKDITLENVYRTFALAKEAGIRSLMFLIVGFPGETRADIKLTCDLIRKVKPDMVQVKIATPYPGSELMRYLRANNLLDNKLETLDDYYKLETHNHGNHHTNEMTTEEIRRYHRLLNLKFVHDRSYFIKFVLKSLTSVSGWKKVPGRIKIVAENLLDYLKVKTS
jgi:radical SAM superfamily enzyme YgiQ (UPF0313 family)